jgi:hypothetical protein
MGWSGDRKLIDFASSPPTRGNAVVGVVEAPGGSHSAEIGGSTQWKETTAGFSAIQSAMSGEAASRAAESLANASADPTWEAHILQQIVALP